MRAPDFWERNGISAKLICAALAPLSFAYAASVRIKARRAKPYRAHIPVICIGNISAGGTGKTPIAIAVADAVIARGKNPFFLTRGYGGRAQGPLVVTKEHTAVDVGDEPLLLARKATTIVSRDRRLGAMLAEDRGADVVIMDDGHQNFSLHKDLNLIVVDGEKGFGNHRVLPCGPLREPAVEGLARADAVILSGNGDPDLPGYSGPVMRALVSPSDGSKWQGRPVLAFAGIGRPEKFFRTLNDLGAALTECVSFGDHHNYSAAEIAALKARAQGAQLVTTEKDYVRLSVTERDGIAYLPITAAIAPHAPLDQLLDSLGWAR